MGLGLAIISHRNVRAPTVTIETSSGSNRRVAPSPSAAPWWLFAAGGRMRVGEGWSPLAAWAMRWARFLAEMFFLEKSRDLFITTCDVLTLSIKAHASLTPPVR